MLSSWLISSKLHLLLVFLLPEVDLCGGIVYISSFLNFDSVYMFVVHFVILQVLLDDVCAILNHMEMVSIDFWAIQWLASKYVVMCCH